jgi:aryl carrier-like protein
MTQREYLEPGSTAVRTGIGSSQVDQSPVLTSEDRPQGETEITVESVFVEMFGISGLPRTASFFDQGFDSLAVGAACARLEQKTGIWVSFSQLFRTPTVAELGAWIDAARNKDNEEQGASAKVPAAESAMLVAITPIMSQTVPTDIVVETAWWFDGEIDVDALDCAVSDVHARHQALHARYLAGPDLGLAEVPADPGRAQFCRLGQEDSEAAASDAFWQALRQPFRLGEGEVWRCAIVRSGDSGRTLFGFAVHHTAFDGHSAGILATELPAAYSARAAGMAPQWSGRVASLAEMAANFRHQLAAADVDAQRRYWRNELRELPACDFPRRTDTSAPTDSASWRQDVHNQSVQTPEAPASSRAFRVEKSQLRVWEDYARAKSMSVSVCMAAVYVQAIIRAGGSRDFAMMVPIANRAGEVIDRTITNRAGNILLRPNTPSRSGPHILARMQDAYHHAMATRDILLDLEEMNRLVRGDDSDGPLDLSRLAHMAYQTYDLTYETYNSILALNLGGVVGTIPAELGVWSQSQFPVSLQVVPGSEGISFEMIVRTDMYEASLADRLSQHFTDIVNDGPERLELETAS